MWCADVYGFFEVNIDWYLHTLAVFGYLNTFKNASICQVLNTLNKYLLNPFPSAASLPEDVYDTLYLQPV